MALSKLPASKRHKPDETGLRDAAMQVIRYASDNAPRSLQKAIGPSQVGTPCTRQLAYEMSGTAPSNKGYSDPWPSYVGTAVHAKLEESFQLDNERLIAQGKEPRWITERRVDVGFGLTGSCDLYDTWTKTVGDFKILGNTTYTKYTKNGPSDVYRKQAHAYGLGYLRAGLEVERVAILFFGRAKMLNDLHVWHEPFDMELALRTLKRMKEVREALDRGATPQMFSKTPGDACYFCAYKGCEDDGYCENGESL